MEHFKLLIIGAGASGIAAATRLLANGFSNFRIVEAEGRIGGRINTASLGNVSVELGAEWIHGETGNVVYELASKFDLADNSTKEFFHQTKFFDFSGNQINNDISVALTTAFYSIMNTDLKDVDEKSLKGSIGEYFEVKFQDAVNDFKKNLNLDDKLCQKFLKTFENWENSIDGSHSWYDTSLCGHLEYWECPGNIITRWKNNCYFTLFHLLTKSIIGHSQELLLDDKILFNKEVSCIKWNKNCELNVPNVEIECSDGTTYYANHVLLTCSLGVLKKNSSKMFCPALPPKKLACIENLGFGTVDKIFIKFSHRWWKEDSAGFAFLWSEDERKNDCSGWLNGVICFHPIDTDCAVLRGWITGEAAQYMETLPSHEIVQGLNYLLDKFLGSCYSIPSIESFLVSNWYTNPHFRGSYSCRLLKSEKSNVWASDLAEPVYNSKKIPILLFGGEATHDHYFSTVHGAVEAGQREANRLLPFLMRNLQLKSSYQVAIIGAGISGLAAAKTLFENGVTDVIVLEAQAKPGGRICSLKVGDCHLELGAQWIHGEKNEVFLISKKNHLLTDEYSSEGEGLYLRENGEVIDEIIVREVDDVVKDILEGCEEYALNGSENNAPQSIGQELLTKFDYYLQNSTTDTETTKEIKRDLLDWHTRFQLIDNACFDLKNLSAKLWGLFKFCGGSEYVNFKNGYSSLIDTLLSGLPENWIMCSTPVQHIDWAEKIKMAKGHDSNTHCNDTESNHMSKIICENGLSLSAQYVIVTCSLGFLKANYKTMFRPLLPNYLSEAIEGLDFGILNKLFLIYDKAWWDPGVKGFQLIWSQKDIDCSEEEKFWGKYVTGFDVIIKGKPILLGWVGGEGAKKIEQLSEEELGRDATALLQKFYKKSEIPLPKRVIRTTWWSNQYVRGGYSHIPVKCDNLKICGSNLAQPVYSTIHKAEGIFQKPTILLAGESTHRNYFSTVHGAFESGQKQAEVVVRHIQSKDY